MPGKPAQPRQSQADRTPQRESGPAHDAADDGEQRVGPLALSRHVKDDGRALALFERVEGGGG